DLPAMDDDDLRRGKPSCHVAFDEATAILAGDALQAAAYQALLRCGSLGVDDGVILAMVTELTRATGAAGMVGGQCIDLQAAAGRAMDLASLRDMHGKKTGALIEASVVMAGWLGGAGPARIEVLREFGRMAGLCFQVTDDLLDVEASTETLGKPNGSDSRRGVPTFVTLLGNDGARDYAARARDSALKALDRLDRNAAELGNLANYLFARSY
ncbi:MAG: polyprenyl synthetase family protein, partial [Pseudomonadota bacterium]|nr:polyprenyl synthetase family protein [Pseudomonadota bacterium]